jgi:hypothetical protein
MAAGCHCPRGETRPVQELGARLRHQLDAGGQIELAEIEVDKRPEMLARDPGDPLELQSACIRHPHEPSSARPELAVPGE